jgi:hypothetical protein
MSRKPVAQATAVVFALAVLANAALAEPVELTDAKMDQITAGAFVSLDPATNNTNIIMDSLNVTYTRTIDNNYVDSTGVTWIPLVLYYFSSPSQVTPDGTVTPAVGVLYNTATGQFWDGGFQVVRSSPADLSTYTAKFGVGLI